MFNKEPKTYDCSRFQFPKIEFRTTFIDIFSINIYRKKRLRTILIKAKNSKFHRIIRTFSNNMMKNMLVIDVNYSAYTFRHCVPSQHYKIIHEQKIIDIRQTTVTITTTTADTVKNLHQ